MGSSRPLRCAMVHDGVTLRSDEEFSDVISRGMSVAMVSVFG